MSEKKSVEKTVREIRQKTRKKYTAEEKIRIVLEGLRGESTVAELCRREGINTNMYYKWSKEFLDAGKERLLGNTKRQADSRAVQGLKQENEQLKAMVAELSLKVGLGRLQQEPFVVREKGSGTRIAMERFFAQAHVSLSTGMELSSNEAIKQAVEAGLGLGIVSLHTVALELQTARLRILQAEGFPILRKWYVVYPRGKKLSTVAKAFLSFLHDEGRRIAQSLLPQLNAGVPLAAEPGRVVTAEQSSSRTRNAR